MSFLNNAMKFEVKVVYECDTDRDMSSLILKKKNA